MWGLARYHLSRCSGVPFLQGHGLTSCPYYLFFFFLSFFFSRSHFGEKEKMLVDNISPLSFYMYAKKLPFQIVYKNIYCLEKWSDLHFIDQFHGVQRRFQNYFSYNGGGQCIYLSIHAFLEFFLLVLHTVSSKQPAAFPHKHRRNKGQQWERN